MADNLYKKIMRILKTLVLTVACFLIHESCSNIQSEKSNKSLVKLTSYTFGISGNPSWDQSSGNQLYNKYCLMCHQADGSGVPHMFPPLSRNKKITGPSTDLIRIVIFGLEGPIVVNGKDFSQVMPPQDYLNDKQIADILSYIRNTWGNKASVVTPAEVSKVRKAGKK